MSRIFLSHSSKDNRQAVALKRWLVEQDRSLAREIFLDLDSDGGIPSGVRWKDALQLANARCEAVVCLLSTNWEASSECQTEFRTAETLNKRIFIARLEPSTGFGLTREWQWVDLFGTGTKTEIDVDGAGEPVRFVSAGLHRLRDGITKAGIGADLFLWPPPADPGRAPYRGWQPFEKEDAAVYFGRDAQIIRGLDALRGMRKSGVETLFVVLGPSGAGKSSFLRAGLLPRLQRDDRNFFLLDTVRPERNVLTGDTGLARAIAATRARLGLKGPPLGEIKNACLNDAKRVHELLAEARDAASTAFLERPDSHQLPTLVIPVDQAEELFGTDASRQAPCFLELIGELAGAGSTGKLSLIVVFTLRTDHFEALQTAPQLSGVTSVVFDELRPMPRTQFLEVILAPAARAAEAGHRLEIEPALVEQLLADCTDGADTLPLLSLTMARLYEEYGADGDLTLDEYRAMGEMRNVVQTEIDSILSHEPDKRRAELELLRTAFVPWLATINPDNDQAVRRVAFWADLPDETKPLLDRFVASRLLVRDKRKQGDVVEVALESLLRQWGDLRLWLEEERENLKHADALERGAAEWIVNSRGDAWLLDGERIAGAEALVTKPGFGERLSTTREFVDASRQREVRRSTEQKEREELTRRRARLLRGVLAAVVVVALVAGYVGLLWNQSRREAERRNIEATAWRLISEAEQMLSGSRAGGDARALQLVLAADSLGVSGADRLANTRRGQLKIFENPLVDGAVTPVKSVAMSPDGRYIGSGTNDGKVRIWDVQSGQQLPELTVAAKSPVWSVAFSPDGKWIATGSGANNLQVFDVASHDRIGTMSDGESVQSVSFSPDGKWVATASEDGRVRVWETATGREGVHLDGHRSGTVARAVAFHPGGDLIASGGDDGLVKLWDAKTGRLVAGTGPATVNVMSAALFDKVTSLAFSKAGDRLIVGRVDGSVQVFDRRTLAPLSAFKAHSNAVNSIAFSPDGARIATGSSDNTVRVWDSRTQVQIGRAFTGNHGEVTSVTFSPDGSRIVSGSGDGSVRVWDAIAGLPILAGQREIRAVAFSPDGQRFASGGTDGTVRLWDVATATSVGRPFGTPTPSGIEKAITTVGFDPRVDRFVAGSNDGSVRVWSVASPTPIDLLPAVPPRVAPTEEQKIKGVAFSPDGSRILAAGNDGRIRLWDATSLRLIGTMTTPVVGDGPGAKPYPVWGAAFSPDGRKIVTGSGGYNNSLQVWDVGTLTPDGEPMVGHNGYQLYSVSYSPDGKHIVSGGYDGTIRVWDAASRQPVAVLGADQNPVLSVAYSRNGKWIASAGADGRVRLWDAEGDFDPIGVPLEGHQNWVASVAFSPDDTRILSGSWDSTLQLWSAPREVTDLLCQQLSSNMSHAEWREWVSPQIEYEAVCPDLPTPDE